MMGILKQPLARTTDIGLDVGATGVRAVQLRRAGRSQGAAGKGAGQSAWQIHRATVWQTEEGDEQSSTWNDAHSLATLAQRLEQTLTQFDFTRRSVVIGLTQPDVEVHALELPQPAQGAAEKHLAAAVRWEVERLSRFENADIQTAHWRIPQSRTARTTAIGAAAPDAMVQAILSVCRDAGVDCHRVDIAPCALVRTALLLRAPKRDEVWGVLDVGHRSVRLVLCVDETPVLARAIEGGLSVWMESVAGALDVGVDAAKLHTRDYGLVFDARAAGTGNEEMSGGAVGLLIFKALKGSLRRMATEIERSYEYVLQSYAGRKAGELMLAGGGASLTNLDAYLGKTLGIHVARADDYVDTPDARIIEPHASRLLRSPFSSFMHAVGLALDPEGTR